VVPTQLHRWLSTPEDAAALASFDTVLVGGGPVDTSLRERASACGVRLVATYGMAETCGGCVYDWLPLDGVGVAVAPDGRIRLSGPMLFDGYVDDAVASAEALVDGWFLTSDAGRLDEDGRLHVLGRVDDMVVSGGVNVPAAAVAARLRAHRAVTGAEVVGLPDIEWGNRVVAVVSLAAPLESFSLEAARDWVGEVHPRAWAPREVVVVPRLPMLPNGKIDRLAVRALAEAAS
jgi:O-succinylbenzoic acid--CoA ligase